MILPEQAPAENALQLELYIAGDNLNSRKAIVNLDEIVRRLGAPATVTIVDVLKDKKAAFARRIFVTPSLISAIGGRESLIIGDLSDLDAVVRKLSG